MSDYVPKDNNVASDSNTDGASLVTPHSSSGNSIEQVKTRQQLNEEIRYQQVLLTATKARLIDLQRENYLLCDEEQWFTEKAETVKEKVNGKWVKKGVLIGRINWIETFLDEDTGEAIKIQRSDIVRVDGKWDW